jgi:transcriptional regulator with XRE-family HTH domain
MGYHHGQTIRMYRQQRGLSQSELAERWPKADGADGVNIRYVQDVEYGKKKLGDPATLRKLAAILDIPLWHLGLSEYDPFHPTAWPAWKLLNESGDPAENPFGERQATNDLQHIPPAYYERILRTYTQVEPALFSWTMWNLGLLQLHSQMSYARQKDVSITIFKCSLPSPNVRSLYEIARYNFYLSQTVKLRFSGKESLAGQTIQEGKMLLEADRCAAPIMRRNRIGGCLIVQAPSVIVSSDIEIIQRYADLFSLAFFDDEFYPLQSIDLCTIPADIKQDMLLQEFDLQRLDLVSLNMTDPNRIRRAERLILQRILTEKPGDVNASAR